MTSLDKTVKRECTRVRVGKPCRPKPLIVSLEPGDLIGLREKGTRRTYRLRLQDLYLMAINTEVREQKRLKKQAKGGKRAR